MNQITNKSQFPILEIRNYTSLTYVLQPIVMQKEIHPRSE